jgi:hypothetical protein
MRYTRPPHNKYRHRAHPFPHAPQHNVPTSRGHHRNQGATATHHRPPHTRNPYPDTPPKRGTPGARIPPHPITHTLTNPHQLSRKTKGVGGDPRTTTTDRPAGRAAVSPKTNRSALERGER